MCIYKDCKSSDEMYLTSDDLLKHMHSQHGVAHWVCDYCASKLEADQSFVFKCLEDWEFHTKTKHATFPLSRLPSLAKVSQRRMLEPLACPLCGYAAEHPQSTLDDHIAKHLHEFALRCLPWGTGGNEGDSVNAKTANTSNSSELTGKDSEDGEPAYLNLTEADTPTKVYETLKTTYLRLLGKPDPEHHPIWPYDKQLRERLLSVEERLLKYFSVAESLLKHQANHLTQQQSYPLALADLSASAGFISPYEQSRMSGRLRSYTLDPSSSFPRPENRILEILGSHLLKITHILYQTLLGWGAKRPSNAFELYCEKTRPILKAKAMDVSVNIEEELARGWEGLPDNQREEFQKKSEVEKKNFEDYKTQTTQDTKTMLEDELGVLDAALSENPLYTNIIQLVDFGSRVLKRLEEHQSKLGEVPKVFRHIKAELPVLLDALRQTKAAINAGSMQDEAKKALLPAVEGCGVQVKLLDDVIVKALPASGDSSTRRSSKAILSLQYDAKVEKIAAVVQGYIQELIYYLAAASTLRPLAGVTLLCLR